MNFSLQLDRQGTLNFSSPIYYLQLGVPTCKVSLSQAALNPLVPWGDARVLQIAPENRSENKIMIVSQQDNNQYLRTTKPTINLYQDHLGFCGGPVVPVLVLCIFDTSTPAWTWALMMSSNMRSQQNSLLNKRL